MCVKTFLDTQGSFSFLRKEVSIVMFYNGFNLLIDLLLAMAVGYFAYTTGKRDGWLACRQFIKRHPSTRKADQ